MNETMSQHTPRTVETHRIQKDVLGNEANARLIAKAPEMLEILRQLAVLYLPWGNLQDDICALLQEIEEESDGLLTGGGQPKPCY